MKIEMKKPKKTKLQKSKADPNSRYWRNKADKLWSELVRARDGDKCAICGAEKNVQAHHLVDRVIKILRHRLENGISLCPGCHKFNRRLSAHRGVVPFVVRLQLQEPLKFDWVMDHWLDEDVGWDYKAAYESLNAQAT